ncbi:MAG: hypothetical protein JSR60_14585 [Proteobacteria bacterium]|nr:hypothetical protein [Pseudomonadota bacterium]
MRRALAALALLFAVPALAGEVPLGDSDFTTYVRDKVQLYSPAPVRSIAPFTVAIGKPGQANLVFDFSGLHADCLRVPDSCDSKTYDYIQSIVARFSAAASAPETGETVPAAKTDFMDWIAVELRRRLPGDTIAADGMTLMVTRPGGKPIPFDQRAYYQLCRKMNFICATGLRLSLDRAAQRLAPPDAALLRVSLHLIVGCVPSACVSSPSDEPMAPVVRHAFANLEEACFKESATRVGPLTNADRADLGLDGDAAMALCEHDTVLPALAPPAAGRVTVVTAPYAASQVVIARDWPVGTLAAVPARDTLLYTADARAELSEKAEAAFAAAGDLGIAPDIYRWNGKTWEWVAP